MKDFPHLWVCPWCNQGKTWCGRCTNKAHIKDTFENVKRYMCKPNDHPKHVIGKVVSFDHRIDPRDLNDIT